MLLPYGITGFYNSNPPPCTNRSEFKKTCIALCQETNGRLTSFKHPDINMNFYDAIIDHNNTSIHILLNAHYSYIAFAYSVNYFNIEFIDNPYNHLGDIFNHYRIISLAELSDSISYKNHKNYQLLNRNQLNEAELNQIKRWKPYTLGEIIFNFWD